MAAETTPRIGRSMSIDEQIAVLEQDVAELRAVAAELRDQLEAATAPRRSLLPEIRAAIDALARELDETVPRWPEPRPRLTLVADGEGEH
jgi:hypothetical protein